MVCAHGDVDLFCKRHGLEISERYDDEITRYSGGCDVIVTAQKMSKNEYYCLKMTMLRRRIDVVSVYFCDKDLTEFVEYMSSKRRPKYGGRLPFGFRREGGGIVRNPHEIAVVRRIECLRASGKSYREIVEDDGVRHTDGRKLTLTMVRNILMNLERYSENGEGRESNTSR